jgi:hypothetical protein
VGIFLGSFEDEVLKNFREEFSDTLKVWKECSSQ